MDPSRIAAQLDQGARDLAEVGRAAGQQAYLKLPHWTFYGARVPAARKLVAAWIKADRPDLDTALSVADVLWDTDPPVWERRRMAADLVEHRRVVLTPDEVPWLEQRLRESETWALVDSLAATAMGGLVEAHPELNATLDRWVEDEDFWIRRSAVLALMKPLRRGRGDWERLTRYVLKLAPETEFFIRKALGWALREAAHGDPDRTRDWMLEHAASLSGLTIREGAKHLGPEVLAELKARRQAG